MPRKTQPQPRAPTRFDREKAEIRARARRQRGLAPQDDLDANLIAIGLAPREIRDDVGASRTHDKHVQLAAQQMMDEALGRKPKVAAVRRPRAEGNAMTTPRTDTSVSSENPLAQLAADIRSSEFAGTWAKPPQGRASATEMSKRREYVAWRTQLEEQATKEAHVERRAASATPLARARSVGQSASWMAVPIKRRGEDAGQLLGAPEAGAPPEQDRVWLW